MFVSAFEMKKIKREKRFCRTYLDFASWTSEGCGGGGGGRGGGGWWWPWQPVSPCATGHSMPALRALAVGSAALPSVRVTRRPAAIRASRARSPVLRLRPPPSPLLSCPSQTLSKTRTGPSCPIHPESCFCLSLALKFYCVRRNVSFLVRFFISIIKYKITNEFIQKVCWLTAVLCH